MLIDWTNAKWAKLTWDDWEVLEDCLRTKRLAHASRDPDLAKDPRALQNERAYLKDQVIAFDDVYRFARYDTSGMYVAAQLSLGRGLGVSHVPLDAVREEYPTPFLLSAELDEHDVMGVRLQKGSVRKNAPAELATQAAAPTPQIGELSEHSSPTSSPEPGLSGASPTAAP